MAVQDFFGYLLALYDQVFVWTQMDSPQNPTLSDEVIFLRPLTPEDAADHLAGEDEEIARWLSGGRSTSATVQRFLESNQESWRSGGPRRAFGIFYFDGAQLIGSIEVNLLPRLDPGQVNISYGIFRPWRGRGFAFTCVGAHGAVPAHG